MNHAHRPSNPDHLTLTDVLAFLVGMAMFLVLLVFGLSSGPA